MDKTQLELVTPELIYAFEQSRDAAGAYGDAIKAQAEAIGISPKALRDIIKAKAKGKTEQAAADAATVMAVLGVG